MSNNNSKVRIILECNNCSAKRVYESAAIGTACYRCENGLFSDRWVDA